MKSDAVIAVPRQLVGEKRALTPAAATPRRFDVSRRLSGGWREAATQFLEYLGPTSPVEEERYGPNQAVFEGEELAT